MRIQGHDNDIVGLNIRRSVHTKLRRAAQIRDMFMSDYVDMCASEYERMHPIRIVFKKPLDATPSDPTIIEVTEEGGVIING